MMILKFFLKKVINQLKKNLSIPNLKNGKTTQENLIELGIYDVNRQSIDKEKFKNKLNTIRENRSYDSDD